MARIGIEWVKKYHGTADNLKKTQKQAEGFYNTLIGERIFNWGDDLAWDQDFEEKNVGSPAQGGDVYWADNVHIAFFSGHGNWTGPQFGKKNHDDGVARHSELKLGNKSLKWIALDACEVLEDIPFIVSFDNGIDAAVEGDGPFSGKGYFFKGDYYLRYDFASDKVDAGYPRRIDQNWHGWPSSFNGGIDAALNGSGPYAGKVYFFKGSQYLRYDWSNDAVDAGYPRAITSGWHGLPSNFQGSFDTAVNGQAQFAGKAYFFKGNQYIRYDWSNDTVDSGYPRAISGGWHGLPSDFQDNFNATLNGQGSFAGKLYFFKGDKYLRYDWSNDTADGGYPRAINAGWHDWPAQVLDVFHRLSPAFAGLHQMLGFRSDSTDESHRGKYFADYLNDGYSVRDAWIKACSETEGSGAIWAQLRADNANSDTTNDHWYDTGFVSPDPTNPTSFTYESGHC